MGTFIELKAADGFVFPAYVAQPAGTPKGGVTAEVIAFESLDALQAADAAAIKGKLVYVGARMQQHKDGHDYGIGSPQRVRGPAIAAAIAQLNRLSAPVLAIDLPSGLLADTGALAGSEARGANADRAKEFNSMAGGR